MGISKQSTIWMVLRVGTATDDESHLSCTDKKNEHVATLIMNRHKHLSCGAAMLPRNGSKSGMPPPHRSLKTGKSNQTYGSLAAVAEHDQCGVVMMCGI